MEKEIQWVYKREEKSTWTWTIQENAVEKKLKTVVNLIENNKKCTKKILKIDEELKVAKISSNKRKHLANILNS